MDAQPLMLAVMEGGPLDGVPAVVHAIVPLAFGLLALATLLRGTGRAALRRKTGADWLLDLLGLTVQGTLVPLLQSLGLFALLLVLAPGLRGSLALGFAGGLLINLFLVDYLYYWNHRLLHGERMWPVHLVHHTMTERDMLGTSRNTLWSSLLIVYLWCGGLALFLLDDPSGYLVGAGITAALDLWKHSELDLPWLDPVLARVLIRPVDHAWHHGAELEGEAPAGAEGSAFANASINFGATWAFWDRLHGTWRAAESPPETLGIATPLSLTRKLLWPFA